MTIIITVIFVIIIIVIVIIVIVIIIAMSLPNTLNDEPRFAKTGKKGGWLSDKNSKYYLYQPARKYFQQKLEIFE